MAAAKGNNYAGKAKEFEGAIKRALIRNDGSMNRIADKLVSEAESGQPWAIQMIADRLDGKPKQQVDLGGADGGPLVVQVVKFADS